MTSNADHSLATNKGYAARETAGWGDLRLGERLPPAFGRGTQLPAYTAQLLVLFQAHAEQLRLTLRTNICPFVIEGQAHPYQGA